MHDLRRGPRIQTRRSPTPPPERRRRVVFAGVGSRHPRKVAPTPTPAPIVAAAETCTIIVPPPRHGPRRHRRPTSAAAPQTFGSAVSTVRTPRVNRCGRPRRRRSAPSSSHPRSCPNTKVRLPPGGSRFHHPTTQSRQAEALWRGSRVPWRCSHAGETGRAATAMGTARRTATCVAVIVTAVGTAGSAP